MEWVQRPVGVLPNWCARARLPLNRYPMMVKSPSACCLLQAGNLHETFRGWRQ